MSKKQDLIKAAIPLFASQGFDATTTLELSQAAGVTEPVIYYHFTNKDGLFSYILTNTFTEYFTRLNDIDKETPTQFEKIEKLINLHFRFVDDLPDETYIILSACPAKLRDSAHICAQQIEEQRQRLSKYISGCLNKGIASGEFSPIPVGATTGIIIALVNGLFRRRSLKLDQIEGLKDAAINFCRKSLMA